jgi:alpha-L-arabinofuranosidase
MNVFERSGEIVEMSAVSDLVNGWPGGIIQAGRHGVFVSPIYLVNQIYNEHRGDVRLAASVDGTDLDAVVSRSADGQKIFIKAVNTSATSGLITTINLQGVNSVSRAEMKTVTAQSLMAFNDFSRPNAINIQHRTIPAGRRFVVNLPKHSVSVIVIRQD